MTPHNIEFTKSAKKEFDRLSKPVQKKVVRSLQLLQSDPYSDLLPIKRLQGIQEKLYRLRIGDYRIVYEVQDAKLLVVIIKIGHRRDVYRRL